MTEKRFTLAYEKGNWWAVRDGDITLWKEETIALLNSLYQENEQLKKDVEYWKQLASQYSNELNVFEHCKKYKTECKDIHWSSD